MHSELPCLAEIWGPSLGCIELPHLPRPRFLCLVRSVDRATQGWYKGGSGVTCVMARISGCDLTR